MLTYSLLDELVSNDLEVSVEPTVAGEGLLLVDEIHFYNIVCWSIK